MSDDPYQHNVSQTAAVDPLKKLDVPAICLILLAIVGILAILLSTLAASLACVPICTPCIVFGIPFGIWALIVLNSSDVKSSFLG